MKFTCLCIGYLFILKDLLSRGRLRKSLCFEDAGPGIHFPGACPNNSHSEYCALIRIVCVNDDYFSADNY